MISFQRLGVIVCICIFFLIQSDFAFGQLEFVKMFGEKGNGDSNFDSPAGIALDSQGKIFVADFINQRIQVWDFSGNFNSSIRVDGQAHGIEIMNDIIYVAVWGNPHIEIFTNDGLKLASFPVLGQPGDIAINDSGKIYVTSYATGRIQIFDTSGNIVKTIPSIFNGIEARNTGITLDSTENIYVTDYINSRVMKLDPLGKYLFEFSIPNELGGEFWRPTNIEINADENIYITDNSGRIFVFDSMGKFLSSFGELGKDLEQMDGPHGIAFDKLGHVYIAEMNNHRIQIFKLVNSNSYSSIDDIEKRIEIESEFEEYIYFIMILITIGGIWLFFKRKKDKD